MTDEAEERLERRARPTSMDLRSRSRLRSAGLVAAGLVVVALAATWFLLSPTGVALRELHRARATWEAREPSSYAFDYFHCGGMCAYCPVHVTVTDGVVAHATVSGEGCQGGEVSDAPTIDDLLDLAARHWPGPFRDASASYDAGWGFPVLIEEGCPPGTMDCGSSWSVSHFEVLAE